jgi:GNAT superfamily N-acetyltransferase
MLRRTAGSRKLLATLIILRPARPRSSTLGLRGPKPTTFSAHRLNRPPKGHAIERPLTPRRWAWPAPGLRCRSTQVAVEGSTICGLATTGLCRDIDLSNFGELMAIYVDPAYLRTGVGRLLMTAARERLRRIGVTPAALWVRDGDVRARRFYERDGWRCDGTRRISTYVSAPATEVRYQRASVQRRVSQARLAAPSRAQ